MVSRRSEITAAQAKLVAANLNFNNEHLILVRDVNHAYYSLPNTAGLRDAAEVSLKDARAVEQAAVDRRANGLATVSEVLEARALSAEANYQLQAAIGARRSSSAISLKSSPLPPSIHSTSKRWTLFTFPMLSTSPSRMPSRPGSRTGRISRRKKLR